jgi:hypothetical protein
MIDPCRVSCHVVGVFPSGTVFIKSLDPQRVWELDFETAATLRYLCISAVDPDDPESPAEFVGVIRVQMEGDAVQCYHTFFSDTPTDEQEGVMSGAILRVMCSRTGHMGEPDDVDKVIQSIKMLDAVGTYEDSGLV